MQTQLPLASKKYDCFGGLYTPWYPYNPPKWFSKEYGYKRPLSPYESRITPGVEGFLSAGIMAVRRFAFLQVGGFDESFGMTRRVGYGEEDDLQLKLHRAGFRIGFSPTWTMQHAVLPHKFSVKWLLVSTFAQARDGHRICPKYSLWQTLWHSFRVTFLSGPLKRFPVGCYRLLTRTDYFWQNFLLEYATPIARCLGRLRANIPIR